MSRDKPDHPDIESPQSKPGARPIWYTAIVLVVAAMVWLGGEMGWLAGDGGSAGSGTVGEAQPESPPDSKDPPVVRDSNADLGADIIKSLFESGKSDEVITGEGTVVHILPDDNDGDRHQRLLVDVQPNEGDTITIKISHNIDLADRLPIEEGDRIRFKGEYEWNDQGGVIHWTHHDPRGTHEDGWIEANGRRVG